MRTKFLRVTLATLVLIAPAFADVVFQLGNHSQPGEENILFKTNQMGMTVDGFTNRSDTMVQFSSTTDILLTKGGQADIDAQDGLINNIMVMVPGHTFQDLIINPFKPAIANDLMITVVTNTGPFTFKYGKTNGNDFLTIKTINGEVIDSVTIDSAFGLSGPQATTNLRHLGGNDRA